MCYFSGCLSSRKDLRPLFFFFSSRRRHTRSLRDWSSDVCSSDLEGLPPEHREGAIPHRQHLERALLGDGLDGDALAARRGPDDGEHLLLLDELPRERDG